MVYTASKISLLLPSVFFERAYERRALSLWAAYVVGLDIFLHSSIVVEKGWYNDGQLVDTFLSQS